MDLDAVASALAPRLVAYALGRTGCHSTAEDVAQEALTALVKRWRGAGPPESPEAFVFTIARRRATRANARRALMSPIDALRDRFGNGIPTEDLYGQRLELKVVMVAIRRLSKRDREVLLLRVAGDLEIDEIAAVAGTTPAAAKMRLHRARQRLSDLLPEKSYGKRKRLA